MGRSYDCVSAPGKSDRLTRSIACTRRMEWKLTARHGLSILLSMKWLLCAYYGRWGGAGWVGGEQRQREDWSDCFPWTSWAVASRACCRSCVWVLLCNRPRHGANGNPPRTRGTGRLVEGAHLAHQAAGVASSVGGQSF